MTTSEPPAEHAITPLELFFDLMLVWAFTQVTTMIAHRPTPTGVLHGMLVLGMLWFAWSGYALFTSAVDADEGGMRFAVLAATGAMLGVGLAVPQAFGEDALLFGLAYLVVRYIHLALVVALTFREPDRRSATRRFLPTAALAPLLLVIAAFVDDGPRLGLWIAAVAVDYLGPIVVGVGEGWRVGPEHIAERYGQIILIALGESLIAIGLGAQLELVPDVLAAAALGFIVVAALWWLYFDVTAYLAHRQVARSSGLEQARMALHLYMYVHLPMVSGIVLFAFGLKVSLSHVHDSLGALEAASLVGGTFLYLLGHVAFMYRSTGRLFRRRSIGAIVLLVLMPIAMAIPAWATLLIVAFVCWSIVLGEAIGHRDDRRRIRHAARA
jgi:low temperature requirement protein LtrA